MEIVNYQKGKKDLDQIRSGKGRGNKVVALKGKIQSIDEVDNALYTEALNSYISIHQEQIDAFVITYAETKVAELESKAFDKAEEFIKTVKAERAKKASETPKEPKGKN